MFGDVVNDKASESLYCTIIKTGSKNTPSPFFYKLWYPSFTALSSGSRLKRPVIAPTVIPLPALLSRLG